MIPDPSPPFELVSYSVHDRIPMVTVWRLEPGPGHPLAPPPNNGD
jgi:hypothetical protein